MDEEKDYTIHFSICHIKVVQLKIIDDTKFYSSLSKYPDLEILITPIKGCSQFRTNQLLTIYQGVHITYFKFINF